MYEVGDSKLQRCQAILNGCESDPGQHEMHNNLCSFFRREKKSFLVFHILYTLSCSMSLNPFHVKNISFQWVVCKESAALCCPRAAIMSSTAHSLQRRLSVLLMIKFTARRRYPHLQLKWLYLVVFGKLCFVDILIIINALCFNLCFVGWFASKVSKLFDHLKMHEEPNLFQPALRLLHLLWQ